MALNHKPPTTVGKLDYILWRKCFKVFCFNSLSCTFDFVAFIEDMFPYRAAFSKLYFLLSKAVSRQSFCMNLNLKTNM